MLLCEKDDVALAASIIEQYNISKKVEIERREMRLAESERLDVLDEEIANETDRLYAEEGEEADLIEVPIELFHRMAAEVEHHKGMLSGRGGGAVLTLGASTTGQAEYGVAKDLQIVFRVALRAPDGHELTNEEIDKMGLAAVDGFRATLNVEMEALKAEILDLRERLKIN